MILGQYRLLAQLGATQDGISYRARGAGGEDDLVEIRVLGGARADAFRWKPLARRLRRAALLDHPVAVRVRELGLEHDPPFVALEWVEGESLASAWRDRVPVSPEDALAVAQALASVLAEAHRLGMSHDRLEPGHVLLTPDAALKLDFTGTREDGVVDFQGDLYGLGSLLAWLRTGRPIGGASRAGSAGTEDGDLDRFIHELLAPDPDDRPSARMVEARCTARMANVAGPTLSTPPDPIGAGAWTRSTWRIPNLEGGADPLAVDDPSQRTVESSSLLGDGSAASLRTVTTWLPLPLGAAPGSMPSHPPRLGRFQILEPLGKGSMGAVYRAEDLADGSIVAIKVLPPEDARRPESLRRFHKEARLLAEANNPYITNLLEVNEDAGLHYLVLEYVEGGNLGQLLESRGKLDEPTALAIVADVARALAGAHERGIVHRDIKPENILVLGPAEGAPAAGPDPAATVVMAGRAPGAAAGRGGAPRVKLSDFGLARHIEESASLMMTQPDALVGTPLYMAPEQCLRGPIDARTDVYSLGVTLYHLLAGRPPFVASRLMDIIAMHQTEAPPPLRRFHPGVSDGACQLVEKAMAKAPEARYADAEAMLRDLERLRRGEPTSIAVHPRLPAADPRDLLHFDFRWDLESDPRQLWPLVSNTERLNRAIGLPAVRFLDRAVPGQGVRRHGQASVGGLPATWEEHPFEWVEPRRLGVLRSYDRGPLKWMVSRVDLASRPGGGTTLTHQVWMAPNIPGLLLRRALALQVRRGLRHSLDRVYRRIDAACAGRLGTPGLVDPFAEPPALAGARRARLERLLDLLIRRGLDIEVVERLGEYLTQAPAQEVARLRPLALAHRLGLEPDAVVAFCLHGAKEGLLVLLWDILCPACRIPSEVQDSLRALRDHAHCAACDLDFDLDFARNVELVFRVHPEIREADLGTYCIGGPAHSPHVVAQVRVAAGERLELELELSEGSYRLRGPQLPYAVDLRVQPHAPARRWELALAEGPEPEPPRVLRSGAVVLALANEHDRELVVRLERTATRDDALTAARASSLALFRELFADEVLGPGQLASVASVTLLVTDLDRALRLYQELGDGRAFTVLREHFRRLDERVRGQGGAVIKTLGEGVLASFTDPAAAVRAALDLLADPPRDLATCGVRVRAGLHRGAAMVTTLNDHLDYFGSVVSQTTHLLEAAGGEDLVLTQPVASDPGVAAELRSRGLQAEVLPVAPPGLPGGVLHRLIPAAGKRPGPGAGGRRRPGPPR